MTSGAPLNRLLEKVKNLIPSQPQKEKEEKNEKDEPLVKPAEKEEKGSSPCPTILDIWRTVLRMRLSQKNV